jgi:hypothetical protein
MFADKYLKKRYLLPQKGHTRSHFHCLSEKRAHALRVSLLTQIASSRAKSSRSRGRRATRVPDAQGMRETPRVLMNMRQRSTGLSLG